MTTCVLDACALIALLRNEPGGEDVRALLADEACRCFVHAVNLCEVYYDCLRNYDEARGRISLADAFAVTLAEREQAVLVTSDHHEFDPLLAAGTLPIHVRFIR